jgi:transketolase
MKLPVVHVFTHDSIAVGEDGPTHQPIEQIASLRAIPGLTVIRPADANETVEAWRYILTHQEPTALVLSRQNLPVLEQRPKAGDVSKGAYILADSDKAPSLILIATGSEVALALKAWQQLTAEGIAARLVNMPSWELFEAQPQSYRESVLPSTVRKRLAVEAGSPQGWERYVGLDGAILGMTDFGASGPGETVMKNFGFTVENIVKKAKTL